MNKNLVAYFSCSGKTKEVAEYLASIIPADMYEIKPVEPYTKEDLNWNVPNSRSSVESKNLSIMPEIENPIDISGYDTIYLGFPIWWYRAPNIINNFLKSNDFKNKKIILFATSGGSDFGKTARYLIPYLDDSTILIEGKVFTFFNKTSIDKLKDIN